MAGTEQLTTEWKAVERRRRPVRDAIVNIVMVVLSLAAGLIVYDDAQGNTQAYDWVQPLDLWIGLAACPLLFFRRRWPVHVAVATMLAGTVSDTAWLVTLLAIFTVAVHRPFKVTAIIALINLPTLPLYAIYSRHLRLADTTEVIGVSIMALFIYSGAAAWGLFIRSRRQLVYSLEERAERAEDFARLQAEQAQLRAREEIAREMHDVLGHRLSLLSVHAGALAYRPDAPTEEIAGAAEVIRASAHQALQDLREVIGVLRAPVGELPQPMFADLPGLVESSRQAGMVVDLHIDAPGNVPDHLGRTAYRVVREGLTNALKHAPDQPVRIHLIGVPGDGLTIEMVNPAPGHSRSTDGKGLLGLAERARLADGRIEQGRTAEGEFRLWVWLPWPA
ncbi:sensor histidine kinase [Kribbella deserti]|uniref:histidine kinase n=1 Tax=Kribbella deserti TaxID=1926257 RepID=A0ABV6QSY1_9ACTN